ncbi:hypothetical protein [Planctomonas psychrotolerans]|uniref:hypothetical protein n=1 Tax=Planctomonas psychrotolerans TaxID=2528712 RepID=UPI001D0D372D|nr:hypothetical protein [Planctomonas psychrotolerans]
MFIGVGLIVGASFAGVMGVGLLQVGYTFGWAFFPLAGTQIVAVIFFAWLVLGSVNREE